MAKRKSVVLKFLWLFYLSTLYEWDAVSAREKFDSVDSVSCSDVFEGSSLPCLCSSDVNNGTVINCNGIAFLREFPVLPHRQRIHVYSQSNAGLQSLEAQLFTASDIPLQVVDFSNNLLRRLTERTFDGIEDTLKELNLRNNKLGDQLNSLFSSGEFHRLLNLEKLDLSGNEIKEFQSGIFNGLLNLKELKLENNSIVTVPRLAIQGLQSLSALHLQGNYILDIGVHSFPNLTKLQFLNLSINDVVNVQDGAFSSLQSLKTLILSNNQIQTLGPGFLDGLIHLEYLDLSQNLLEDFSVYHYSNSSLKKLILYSNKIRSLNKVSLNSFIALEYLDLQRNRIFQIAPNTFTSMSNLKELHLDINIVRKIVSEMFTGLENLSDLTLNDNRILAFPTEPLTVFTNLKKLNLDYNRIAAISREILAPVNRNKELSLAFNLISEIPDGTFMEFKNLELLNLHGNKISNFSRKKTEGLEESLLYLDIGYNEISELPQLHFSNLLILSLAKNKISKINTETLKFLNKIIYLNMSFNMLTDFPSDLFIELQNMEHLDMQQNLLTQIPIEAFKNLSLTELNLNNNKLLLINQNTFENLIRLKYLDLSLNAIEVISENAFSNVPNIEVLNLMKNKLLVFKGDEFSTKTKINTLILSHNKIANLNPRSFIMHSGIKHLDLSFNDLSVFPHEAISSLQLLMEINLEGNRLLSVGDGYFSDMPYLKRVNLQNNLIVDVSESAFKNSSNLRSIFLQNNQITTLPESTFAALNQLQLDISNNNLTTLPSNIFSRMRGLKLESINLARNNFKDFPNEALKKQYSFLEKINISYNKIRNLPSNADILVNVKELDLSYNPLSADAHHVLFSEPKSARKLHVEGVGIDRLPTVECPFLRQLNLKANRISQLNSDTLERANMLVDLDISHNMIPNLNLNVASAWGKLPYLQSLDLSGNPIRYISKSDFSNLLHLRHLNINNLKELAEISCDGFRNLPRLRHLQMSGFHSLSQLNVKQCLESIRSLEFLGIEIKDLILKDQLQAVFSPKLDTLKVSGNNLHSVSSSAFAGMLSPAINIQLTDTSVDTFTDKIFLPLPLSSKIEFNIPRNKIQRLTPEILSVLDNKQVDIIISGLDFNPVKCDCHIKFLWTWLQEKMKISVNRHQGIITLSDLTCFQPENLQGRKINDIKSSDLVCDESTSSRSTDVTMDLTTHSVPAVVKETTPQREQPFIIFEPPVTKKPSVPSSYVPASGSRSTLTKVDTMIIGIVAGVVAFVCILIIIICIVRLRRAHPLYTAGPLAGPLAFRAQGKCTCLKPPPNSCTCYPMYSMPYGCSGRPALPGTQHKMLPPSLPPPPGFLNSAGQSGRLRNTPYYVTYPDSDNENK